MLKNSSSCQIAICSLCPHHCHLQADEHGKCGARINKNGAIVPLFYGKLCTAHIDPIEKKPFYHVLPGTPAFSLASAGCNLHCSFCQNWQVSQETPPQQHALCLTPEDAAAYALQHACPTIAYTYTEPLVSYEYTYDTSVLARKKGLLNLIVTAGYIEQPPLKKLCTVIDAANVDLKGITEGFYRKICGATLKPVLDTIVTLKKEGVWIEITHLIIPTCNDKEEDTRELVRWVKDNCGTDTPLHFSRFYPMHKQQSLPPTPEHTLTIAAEIAKQEGLHYVYTGNLPANGQTKTVCPSCHKMLICRSEYTLISNALKDGKCPACGILIPGIWTIKKDR